MKICRESYSDYEVAADLVNKEYDIAMLNFKLGQSLPAANGCGPGWSVRTAPTSWQMHAIAMLQSSVLSTAQRPPHNDRLLCV